MSDIQIKDVVSEILINSESVAEKKSDINKMYMELGKVYFESGRDNSNVNVIKLTEQIQNVKSDILQLEKKLEKIISDITCISCNTDSEQVQKPVDEAESTQGDIVDSVEKNTKVPIVQDDVVPVKRICKKCGTAVAEEMHFCIECGCKFDEDYVSEQNKCDEKICPKCGKHSAPQMRFCTSCGTRLDEIQEKESIRCPRCAAEITGGMVFCTECGYKVAKEQAEPKLNPYAVSTEKSCPRCGSIQSSAMKFCTECGAKL